jgi:hypothetical protein
MVKTLDYDLSGESDGDQNSLAKLIATQKAAGDFAGVANLAERASTVLQSEKLFSEQARTLLESEKHLAGVAGIAAAVTKAQDVIGAVSSLSFPQPVVDPVVLKRYEKPEEIYLQRLIKETRASASEQRRLLNAQGNLLAVMADSLSTMTDSLTTMVTEQRSSSRRMITIELVGSALIIATLIVTVIALF